MDANEIMQAFDKQYGSAAILPTIALFAGIAIGVIGIIGLIISLIGKGKTTGIGKISSVLTPVELILGIISLLAFAGVTAIILLGTNGITEPNDLFYGFAYTPAKFGMPISENGPIDTVVIITYAIVFALPALLCLGAAVVGFIGKGKAKNAAANITAQPQFAMNAVNGQPTPQPNMAQQPVPQPNTAQQPVTQPDMAGQPAPQPDMAQQPVPQPEMVQQPVTQPDMVQQPIPQPNLAQQPVPQPEIAQQPAPKKDMISCPVCGNELEADRTFCTKCGVKLALADEEDDNIPSAPVDNSAQTDADIINESQPTDNVIAAAPFAAEPASTVEEDSTPTEILNATAPVETELTAPETAPVSEPAPENNIGGHICAVCGNVLNENSAFCTKCGTPVNAQPTPEVAPVSEPAPETAPAVEAVPTDTQSATAPVEDYSGYFDAPETAPENNIGAHICTVCGNVLNENSAFCTKCGTPINAQPAPEVTPAVESVPADTPNTTTPAEDYRGYFDAPEPAPENNIGAHICAVCGNVLNENSAFCTKCGTPVNSQPAPEVVPAVEAVPADTQSATAPAEDYSGYFDAPEPAPEVVPAVEEVPTDTPNTTAPTEDYSGYFDAPETAPVSELASENNIGGHICAVCGNVLNENSAFCTKCGTPVNAQPAPEVAPINEVTDSTPVSELAPETAPAVEAVPTDTPNTTAPAEDYSGYFDANEPAPASEPVPEVAPVVEAIPTDTQSATVPAEDYSGYFDATEPAPENNIGAHICAVCGNVLNENSAFCTKCGTPVNAQPAPEVAPAVEAVPTDTQSATAPAEEYSNYFDATETAPASEPVPENNIGGHICAVCGNVLNENSAFCTKCGTPVNAQPAPEVAPAVEEVPTDTQSATATAEDYSGYFDAPEPAPASEPAPENNIGGHICAVCGNVLNENSAFCTKCGTPVNAQPAPEVAPAVEAVPTYTPNTTAPAEEYSNYFDAPESAPASEPAPENNIGGHICTVCGNVLNENSAFCTKCGTPVNAQPAPEVVPAVEAVPADTQSATAPAEDYSGYFDAPETASASEPAPENNIGGHICAVCGNVLNENSAFCTKCGTPVNAQPAPEVAPAVEAVPTDTPNTTAPAEDYSGYFDATETTTENNIGGHICAVCGNVLNENSAFCTKCGTPVNAQPAPASEPAPENNIGGHICAVCGNVLNENSAFCTKCGTPVNAQPAPAVEAVPTDTQSATAPAEDYSNYFDAPETAPVSEPAPDNNIGGHICAVCGNVLNENSAFCTKCGTPVNAQPAPEVVPAVESVPTDTQSATAPAEDYSGYFDATETAPVSEPAPENNIGDHICAVCGNVLNENSAFCTKCGTPVNAQPAPVEAVQPVPVAVPTSETAQPVPQSNTRFCVVCGNVLNETSAFCTRCGTPVASANSSIACPCCGTKLTKETKFCVKCGTKIQ